MGAYTHTHTSRFFQQGPFLCVLAFSKGRQRRHYASLFYHTTNDFIFLVLPRKDGDEFVKVQPRGLTLPEKKNEKYSKQLLAFQSYFQLFWVLLGVLVFSSPYHMALAPCWPFGVSLSPTVPRNTTKTSPESLTGWGFSGSTPAPTAGSQVPNFLNLP